MRAVAVSRQLQEGWMIRRAAAVVLALTLSPTLARAQDTVLTVSVPSADVHKAPTNVTPVIGHVPRGTVLPVLRNLGSWVKVAWPDAPDGFGYVHVTMGRIGPANADAPATKMSSRASVGAAPPPTSPPPTHAPASEPVAPRGEPNVRPISHLVGVGGLVGSMSSVGATARTWRKNHVAIQLQFTRDAMTSDAAAGRVTSVQFEPGVLYALFDRVSDYVWIRPYVGSAVSFRHQTLRVAAPVALEPASDNGLGFRVFGGGELTFATMTQFGLSVDLGYRRFPTAFPGFEAGPLTASIAGHWYIK
jgi:hypothetical protein